MSLTTTVLVAGLTHLVAAAPHATPAPGAKAWVVEVDERAGVFDEAGAEHPLSAALTECLRGGAVSEVVRLVGERGVVVVAGGVECVVTARSVSGVDALKLPVSWREYALRGEVPAARSFLARVVKGSAFVRLQREAWRRQWERAEVDEPTLHVPACGCSLVSRERGPVVLLDGGVAVELTEALRARLGDWEGRYSFEALDGGVRLAREVSTNQGGCPVGESFVDRVDARWDARARRFEVAALPTYAKEDTAPRHRQVALDFDALPHDGGVVVETPHFSLTADYSVTRGGRLDRVDTRFLRELIRARCTDWPAFAFDGDVLRAEEDRTSGITRCGGEILGCALEVRFAPEQGRLREVPRSEAPCLREAERLLRDATLLEAEAMARWCVDTAPTSGLAELTLARVLEARSPDLARAHAEVALARGLPAKSLGEARRLFSASPAR